MMFPQMDRPSIEARLLANSIPEPNSGCWLWTASTKNGYGQITLRHERGLGPRYAHRVSFEVFKCELPEDALILHSCDMRCCINPDHLRGGSQRDNALDMMKRNRGKSQIAVGDRRFTRLSDLQVAAIKSNHSTAKKIATEFSISARYVLQIKSGARRQIVSRSTR